MPYMTGLSEDTTQEYRINDFFKKSSIFVGNKFVVGFWGDAVQQAIDYMDIYSTEDPLKGGIPKEYKKTTVHSVLFDKWRSTYIVPDTENTEVDMKWACEGVKIPHAGAKTITDFNIDTDKSIAYPLVQGHEGAKTINLTITEDKRMMWYQFFNALQNQFFDPLILKPKSSFHRLGMYIGVLQGHQLENLNYDKSNTEKSAYRDAHDTGATGKQPQGAPRDYVLEEVPMQIFEFNSVVMTGMSDTILSNTAKEKMSFNVSIQCPNMFHGSFKTMGNFRGLRNNSSDKGRVSGTDSISLQDSHTYNHSAFVDTRMKR
jgi:hypothetical protein